MIVLREVHGESSCPRAFGDTPVLTVIGVLVFVFATSTLFAVFKTLNLPPVMVAATGALGLMAALVAVSRLGGRKQGAIAWVWTLLAVAVSVVIADCYFDFSPDGTFYHQDAILQMQDRFRFTSASLHGPQSIWTNHYPKLSWYFASALTAATGNVHLGKSLNVLAVIAVAAMSARVFADLPLWRRIVVVVAIATNPIAMSQLFTHYVDGLMAGFLTLAILGLVAFVRAPRDREAVLVTLMGALGCATLKHTGLVFAGILIAALLAGHWLARRRETPGRLRIIGAPATGVAALMACVLLFNPYVTNLMQGKHLFHPALGEQRVKTLISGQTTPEFFELGRFSKLTRSVFGKTENIICSETNPLPTWKLPLTFDGGEVATSCGVDVRWGGWGPLFGGALLLTAAAFVLHARQLTSQALVLAMVALLAVINPESWWARLNPQLHTLVALTLALLAARGGGRAILPSCLLILLIANSALVFSSALDHVQRGNAHVQNTVRDVANAGDGSVRWTLKTAHLEPIFDRLGIAWTSAPAADEIGATTFSRDVLGETVYSHGR